MSNAKLNFEPLYAVLGWIIMVLVLIVIIRLGYEKIIEHDPAEYYNLDAARVEESLPLYEAAEVSLDRFLSPPSLNSTIYTLPWLRFETLSCTIYNESKWWVSGVTFRIVVFDANKNELRSSLHKKSMSIPPSSNKKYVLYIRNFWEVWKGHTGAKFFTCTISKVKGYSTQHFTKKIE